MGIMVFLLTNKHNTCGPHIGAEPSIHPRRQFLSTVVLSYWILIAAQAVTRSELLAVLSGGMG
jgi:hypothetical protein